LPAGIGAGGSDSHRLPPGEVTHLEGPPHQLPSHVLPSLAPVMVAVDQTLTSIVEPFQFQHPVVSPEGILNTRVDLDAQGAVGDKVRLIISKEHQAETGG